MPEGPEVAKFTKGLNNLLKNKFLTNIEITPSSRYRNKNPDGLNILLSILKNKPLKIKEIKCKGKLIYFVLSNNVYILNRLGMAGIWKTRKEKHTSIILSYKSNINSSYHKNLYFIDVRHFGLMKIVINKLELNNHLDKIGPDLLSEKVSFTKYKEILLKNRKKNICKVMMDQTQLSGIGNYLKAEILYDVGLSPLNIIENIPQQYIKKLYNSSIKLINKSYNSRLFKFKVYGNKFDPFYNKVSRIKTPDGRNTYYVPQIQKLFDKQEII